MRASFGHMERPDNSEYRPTVETIRGIEKSNRGSKIATVAWMIIFGGDSHFNLKILRKVISKDN